VGSGDSIGASGCLRKSFGDLRVNVFASLQTQLAYDKRATVFDAMVDLLEQHLVALDRCL
jgi:hypothetical protein